MILTALFYTFIAVIIIQLCYLLLFIKLSFPKSQKVSNSNISVSVIICARNEAENINLNLESILNQNHNNFEVIVVNDASTDNTGKQLSAFNSKYANLRIVNIEATATYTGNKKRAITQGVDAALNEYLLFTDADCKPVSKNWITEMTSQFDQDKAIVLGYGGYRKIKNSLLNKLVRYETLLTAIQYFSYAKVGMPYMGVGRNLAYTKQLFTKAKGFSNHIHLHSGDDDLFISQMATKKNTAVCLTKDSFTISEPKKTIKTFILQKRRHITTANEYKPHQQFLLTLFYITQLLFWILAIILLTFSFNWQLVTILIIIRLIVQNIILGHSAQKLHEKDLILYFSILDFILVFFQFGIYIRNLISKPRFW